MHERIQILVDAARELNEQWTDVAAIWNATSLSQETKYPRLHGASFPEFNRRVIATLELTYSLGRVDEAGQVLFLPKVDLVSKHLKSGKSSVDALLKEFRTHPTATYRESGDNLETVQGFVDGSHVITVNVGQHLDALSASLTALLDILPAGVRYGKAKGVGIFLGYAEQLQELVASSTLLREQIKTLKDATTQLKEKTQTAADSSQEHESKTKDALSRVSEAQTAITAAQGESESKLNLIKETAKNAATLEAQIAAYSATFDAFQKSLDDKLNTHTNFEQDMSSALLKNNEREGEIDRLIVKANAMIQGATTAGLGSSLEDTRSIYATRMWISAALFAVSVVLLAASAIPLVAHILPGLFVDWLPVKGSLTGSIALTKGVASAAMSTPIQPVPNGWDALISLLGKVFLMFPATWLTQFFSKSYAEFFHLEREYAHKAALARSVEGFKKQAPDFEQEITTAVFFEVQSNPSKKSAPDPAEHPIMGPLMKKFIEALPFSKIQDKAG
jgi:hypothetical protein